MQLATAVAPSVLYVGLTLVWGGVPPDIHVPWWVLAPFIVTFVAGLLSWLVSARLPAPWAGDRVGERAPRRVRLSWRAAFRIPGYLPILVLLCDVYWSVGLHFDIGWVAPVAGAVAAIVVTLVARGRRREFALLRDGERTMAVVDERLIIDAADLIAYHFTTSRGVGVSGRGWDLGYGVAEGSSVPVFHHPADPGKLGVACSSRFEAV
jgi:hypothetical protein